LYYIQTGASPIDCRSLHPPRIVDHSFPCQHSRFRELHCAESMSREAIRKRTEPAFIEQALPAGVKWI
ncbi:MAG TPA: hypothetical protein VIS71_01055, partial [Terrimicrobium sp.]